MKLKWNALKDKKPGRFEIVLVSQALYGDQAYTEYFVAMYNKSENNWRTSIFFPCKGEGINYTSTFIGATEADIWAYFEFVPDEFIERKFPLQLKKQREE